MVKYRIFGSENCPLDCVGGHKVFNTALAIALAHRSLNKNYTPIMLAIIENLYH